MVKKTLFIIILLAAHILWAQAAAGKKASGKAKKSDDERFVIKRPGEITFTTGIVIEGRIEKPQVIIVLSKEEIKVKPVSFSNSFLAHVVRPLRQNTFELFTEEEEKEDIKRKTRRNQ